MPGRLLLARRRRRLRVVGDASPSPFSAPAETLALDERTVIETGRVARQSDAAVMMTRGGTTVLVTVCSEQDEMDADFVPLQVHYQERLSAGGMTSGGYNKRDGKPSSDEVLTARLIDRPLRPTFPKGWRRDTQVLVWVLSYDGEVAPDTLAVTAAGAAVAISEVPVRNAVSAVRVGMLAAGDGAPPGFVLDPTEEQMQRSELDLVVAGTAHGILMIEGYCSFVPEETLLAAIEFGAAALTENCRRIDAWALARRPGGAGGAGAEAPADAAPDAAEVDGRFAGRTREALQIRGKADRAAALARVKSEIAEYYESVDEADARRRTEAAVKRITSAEMRSLAVDDGVRSDGRGLSDVRAIECNASVLPRTHGSALFTRGETQSLAVVTLGCDKSALRNDTLRSRSLDEAGDAGEPAMKRFYLQYFFPPSSVGETGRMGAASRREIGHGMLAERALAPALPGEDDFPYTVRVESNITESNGSSSMASVCAGCLAMRDAGVPLTRSVAGVAMGLILEKEDGAGAGPGAISKFAVLTDILGSEDFLGDMDFKVAGDEDSVTAFQMDIKVEGITVEIMAEALARAKDGRRHILGRMGECSPPPRNELSEYAPRILRMQVAETDVGLVIGKGGSTVRSLMLETGSDVQVSSTGEVSIRGPTQDAVERARDKILRLCEKPEVLSVYRNVPIKKILDFGCFVEFLPGTEGLVHISNWDHERVASMQAVCQAGDLIDVKLMAINRGKFELSRKDTISRDEDRAPSESLPALEL